MGFSAKLNPLQSLGYKHIVNFLVKKWNWDETLEYMARDTRHYAKRQLTWFGRDNEITWFQPHEISQVRSFVQETLKI